MKTGVAARAARCMLLAVTICCASAQSLAATVVEFYNTTLDNYFITADAAEQGAIDNGAAGPGWIRTGGTFQSGGTTPVCRFYGSQSPGPNSHFYTVSASECQSLKDMQFAPNDPRRLTEKSWNFESLDFVSTPPVDYVCPLGTVPVYRAYNRGFERGVDSNHRITASLAAIQDVVSRGWVNESVAMCAAPEPAPNPKITTSLAATLPASVGTSITEVLTVIASGPLGSAIEIVASAGGRDGLVLALDAAEEIRLAAVEIGADGKVELSAESTALALVRIAVGSLPEGISAQSMNQAIRATAAWPDLLAAINQALVANVPCSTAAAVIAQVAAATTQAAEQARSMQGTTLKISPATLPLPFSMLGGPGKTLSVHLVARTEAGKINIRNSMPLYWHASANGAAPVELGPCDLKCLAKGAISSWLGPDPKQLPDAGGEAFMVHLEQNSTTRKLNAVNAIRATASAALDVFPGASKCTDGLAKQLYDSDKLNGMVTYGAFKAYAADALKSVKWLDVMKECFSDGGAGNAAALGKTAAKLLGFATGVSEVMAAAEAGAAAIQLSLWRRYFDTEIDVKICEAKDDRFGWDIANCATKVEPASMPLVLAAGAKVKPDYQAYDVSGKPTGMPVTLKFASASPLVSVVNETTGELIAGAAAGTANITVGNTSIPLASTFSVIVSELRIAPAAPTVVIGGLISLQLVDAAGRPINAKGSGTEWNVFDTTIADIVSKTGTNYPNSVLVSGKKAGTTAVYAYNPVSGQTFSVNLVVEEPKPPGPNGDWIFTTTSCTPLDTNPPDCNTYCNATVEYTLAANPAKTQINMFYPVGTSSLAFELAPVVPPSGQPPPRTFSGCYKASGSCEPSALVVEFSEDYRSSPSWAFFAFYGACGVDQRGTAAMK